MRIIGIEALNDELRMVMILGEDDRFPEPIACGDFQSMGHQVLKHLVDGVRVEQLLVDRWRIDLAGDVAIFVPLDRVPLFFSSSVRSS
jgi:hypothetical protein